jgi:hypothetical protein
MDAIFDAISNDNASLALSVIVFLAVTLAAFGVMAAVQLRGAV